MWIQLLVLELIDGAGTAAVVAEQPFPTLGSWDRFAKQGKKKQRIIRYSDFETREAYAAALANAALPIANIPIETDIDEWEEIEDTFIAFELMRLLH